jgi:hypothetical protein
MMPLPVERREAPRMPLLRTRLNKGKKEGRSPEVRTPEPYESALWMVKRTRSPSYVPG